MFRQGYQPTDQLDTNNPPPGEPTEDKAFQIIEHMRLSGWNSRLYFASAKSKPFIIVRFWKMKPNGLAESWAGFSSGEDLEQCVREAATLAAAAEASR